MDSTVPPRRKPKVYSSRPGRELAFWFRDTFTATKRRSIDNETSWLDKEQVAFNSLKHFGLVRGDYHYVHLVDRKYGSICDYEKTSASFARAQLSIPEEYNFLDLNGVVSIHCLCFFAQDYVRLVNNLLAAIRHGKPIDTAALKTLLFTDGRLLDPKARDEIHFQSKRNPRPYDTDLHNPEPRPIPQATSHTVTSPERGPGRRPKRTSDQISGAGEEKENEPAVLGRPEKRSRRHPPPPADRGDAYRVLSPAAPNTRTIPRKTPGGKPSHTEEPRLVALPTTERDDTPAGEEEEEEGSDWATARHPHILMAMSGIFQTRKGRYFGQCAATPEAVKSGKAKRAVLAMGMSRQFPMYDELVDSQSGLGRYENTTTEFVMRGLRIRELTGAKNIRSVDCGLTIFVLSKMAADHHRLITGLRRQIAIGTYMDKKDLIQVLYHYTIDSRTFERLDGTYISSAPLCDEPEWEDYMRHWNWRRESRQSAVELD